MPQTSARSQLLTGVPSRGSIKVSMTLSTPQKNALEKLFRRMVFMGKDVAPLIKQASVIIRQGFNRNFEFEASGGGRYKWAPLQPMTKRLRGLLALKSSVYQNGKWVTGGNLVSNFSADHPILQRTGSLKKSFTDLHHPLHFQEIDSDWSGTILREGSDDSRVDLLHAGGVNEDGFYVKPRPIVRLRSDSMKELENRLQELMILFCDNDFRSDI